MKTENKVLKYLIEKKEKPTISQLSREIGVSYRLVHTAVNRLNTKKIIQTEKIGKSIRIIFLNKISREVFNTEMQRREDILKNKNLKILLKHIKNIDLVNFVVLLFGSYAKRTFNKKSDIDLVFIIPDKKFKKRIKDSVELLPLNIHYLIFTEKEFINMKNSTKENVIHEVIKLNIILYGIEQYYEILKC